MTILFSLRCTITFTGSTGLQFSAQPVQQARWPEEELKHTAAALRHYDFAGTFPRNIGGAMKRIVLRDNEARAGSICLPCTLFLNPQI